MGLRTGGQATISRRGPSRRRWRVLLAYARPYRLTLVVGGLLSLATGAVGLALPPSNTAISVWPLADPLLDWEVLT